MPSRLKSTLALPLLVVLVAVIGMAPTALGVDHILMHSFYPPILKDYWDHGMRYWSFGSGTIVTDSSVALTTNKPFSHGYLWNRHPNHLESFEFNVTVHVSGTQGVWHGDTSHAGIGFWYTSDTPRHATPHFFGSVNQFVGLGVLLDHSEKVSIVLSDGLDPIFSFEKQRKASCDLSAHSGHVITLQMRYDAQEKKLEVGFLVGTLTSAPSVAELHDPTAHRTNCAILYDVSLPPRFYFGVTAANDENSQAKHEVKSFFAKPLGGAADMEEERQEIHVLNDLKHDLIEKMAYHTRPDGKGYKDYEHLNGNYENVPDEANMHEDGSKKHRKKHLPGPGGDGKGNW